MFNDRILLEEIKRLNTELLRTSNRNNLEIEEYEIELNRLKILRN